MKIQDVVTRAITNDLQVLRDQIQLLVPIAICQIGNIAAQDSFQIYASFVRTPQSETLDLCVAFRQIETDIMVFADLVKGGNGRVLSEMHSTALPYQEEGNELAKLLDEIREYIFLQEDKIVQDLNS